MAGACRRGGRRDAAPHAGVAVEFDPGPLDVAPVDAFVPAHERRQQRLVGEQVDAADQPAGEVNDMGGIMMVRAEAWDASADDPIATAQAAFVLNRREG